MRTQIPPGSLPVELADLALSFNEMLGRIEDAFVRLSNFSADIAHELRTPVAALMTQTQVALSSKRSEDEYRRILYSNLEEYERLAQMTGDMLFLAQADHGLSRLNVCKLNLEEEVRALFDYYEAWAEEHGVTLELGGSATMMGDQLMLRRALGNLLSNAIRHTPSGQTVSVHLAPTAGGEVEILVENPGTIPPEHISRLFDRFYRADPSRQRSGEGAGLGLAIVKSIIEAHGGTIEATSDAGRIRFRIRLPASGPGLNNS
ncbi:MAG: heavy metal sensor histidine kinase [Gammaproteobacteria bacterium]